MNVGSIWFLVFVALVAIVYHLCAYSALRQALLSAVNIGFLVPLVPNGASWAVFTLVIVGTYLLVRWAQARPSGWFVLVTISVVLAGFAVLKHYSFLEGILPTNLWNHSLELIGISYMLFKFIHVLVDAWQGQLKPLNFITYANYQLAFFTLVAGPIQRYNDFQRFWSEMGMSPGDSREAISSWNRILTGLIKFGPLAAIAWHVFKKRAIASTLSARNIRFWFLVYLYAYPVFLYLNFSGYTDIVIGAARLLGFRLPENFDRPYLARNVIDYWNRWHISLSLWIRDYVFMTSYKSAATWFPAYAKYLGWALLFFAPFWPAFGTAARQALPSSAPSTAWAAHKPGLCRITETLVGAWRISEIRAEPLHPRGRGDHDGQLPVLHDAVFLVGRAEAARTDVPRGPFI